MCNLFGFYCECLRHMLPYCCKCSLSFVCFVYLHVSSYAAVHSAPPYLAPHWLFGKNALLTTYTVPFIPVNVNAVSVSHICFCTCENEVSIFNCWRSPMHSLDWCLLQCCCIILHHRYFLFMASHYTPCTWLLCIKRHFIITGPLNWHLNLYIRYLSHMVQYVC